MHYGNIVEFIREQKKSVIAEMRCKIAEEFMSKLNCPNFDEPKEVFMLRVEDCALSRTEELLENILDRLEKGE